MMKKKSKAVVTFKDFEFFTVYEREGGYGQHKKKTLVGNAIRDLSVEHVKGGRPHRTEWYPISCSQTAGFASVKYCATLTWNGIKQLISNANLCNYEHNTMGILYVTGCLPAISLDSGYNSGYYCCEEAEMKRYFKSNYQEEIYEYQGCTHVNCYVAVQIDNNRLEEAIHAVFGKYYSELSDKQRNQIYPQIKRYNDLCELLNDYMERLTDCEDVEVDVSQFTIDFRELQLNFRETI